MGGVLEQVGWVSPSLQAREIYLASLMYNKRTHQRACFSGLLFPSESSGSRPGETKRM